MYGGGFWQDVMRAGAIVGIVMALSHIVEQYVMIYSGMSLSATVLVYSVEWLVAMAIYAFLLFLFAKQRIERCDPKIAIGFSQVLSYVVMVSMFAGVFVGLANTFYLDAMGYDRYVDGMLMRIDEMQRMVSKVGGEELYDDMFTEMVSIIRSSTQPTIFVNIFSSLNSYILSGGFVGLIISAILRRDATTNSNE